VKGFVNQGVKNVVCSMKSQDKLEYIEVLSLTFDCFASV